MLVSFQCLQLPFLFSSVLSYSSVSILLCSFLLFCFSYPFYNMQLSVMCHLLKEGWLQWFNSTLSLAALAVHSDSVLFVQLLMTFSNVYPCRPLARLSSTDPHYSRVFKRVLYMLMWSKYFVHLCFCHQLYFHSKLYYLYCIWLFLVSIILILFFSVYPHFYGLNYIF